MTETPTFRLIYRSHNRIPGDRRKAELGAIFSAARSTNKRLDVTGALLTSGDWFVQALEGDEAVVRDLYERIGKDARHAAEISRSSASSACPPSTACAVIADVRMRSAHMPPHHARASGVA